MDDTILYHQIAESIRKDILEGRYQPGDRLPSVRRLCATWNCTPGTVQRAYSELAREGLLVSRAGRGTQVAGGVPAELNQARGTLRRANLVNRSEAFLLEALTSGFDLAEIQQAIDMAMDRWRVLNQPKPPKEEDSSGTLRFAGSHDMVVNALARSFFSRLTPEITFTVSFSGSLGGLIALAEGQADLAGCHLWDAESDTYNLPFIRRLLPGKAIAVMTLAHRGLGLITAPGNPLGIHALADLARSGVRFTNRQAGSGTRVWLDETLARQGIDSRAIQGYTEVRMTHSEVARVVAEGGADVGLGLESAAAAYGLDFLALNRERYDLAMTLETLQRPAVQALAAWLSAPEGRAFIDQHAGYESQESGRVRMVGTGG